MLTADIAKHIADICAKPELYERLIDPERDLNAMHEAEKVLSRDQLESYQEILYNVVDGKPSDSYVHWSDIGGNHGVFTATAAQRADAFLLTLG